MTNPPQTLINVSLLTGELSGIRVAMTNPGDMQAILVPRDRLTEAQAQSRWNRSAVYLLVGGPDVYIGQTKHAWNRIYEHNRTKPFWKTAVAVISKTDDGFTANEIDWLEWRCIQEARRMQRFKVHSDHDPHQPAIPEYMLGGMSRLFDSLATLISVLGYPVFEPEEDADPSPPKAATRLTKPESTEAWICEGATGSFAEGCFIVRQGSTARVDVVPSAVKTVGRKQKQLLDEGILVEAESGKLRFTRDHPFNSPSGAAAIVLGRAADGWVEWANDDGKTLDEIMRPGGGDE